MRLTFLPVSIIFGGLALWGCGGIGQGHDPSARKALSRSANNPSLSREIPFYLYSRLRVGDPDEPEKLSSSDPAELLQGILTIMDGSGAKYELVGTGEVIIAADEEEEDEEEEEGGGGADIVHIRGTYTLRQGSTPHPGLGFSGSFEFTYTISVSDKRLFVSGYLKPEGGEKNYYLKGQGRYQKGRGYYVNGDSDGVIDEI